MVAIAYVSCAADSTRERGHWDAMVVERAVACLDVSNSSFSRSITDLSNKASTRVDQVSVLVRTLVHVSA